MNAIACSIMSVGFMFASFWAKINPDIFNDGNTFGWRLLAIVSAIYAFGGICNMFGKGDSHNECSR